MTLVGLPSAAATTPSSSHRIVESLVSGPTRPGQRGPPSTGDDETILFT